MVTVEQLKQLCRDIGISGFSNKTKSELIAHMLAHGIALNDLGHPVAVVATPAATHAATPAATHAATHAATPAATPAATHAATHATTRKPTNATLMDLTSYCRTNEIKGYSNKSKVELVTHMAANGITFDDMGHPVAKEVAPPPAQPEKARIVPRIASPRIASPEKASPAASNKQQATLMDLTKYCRINEIKGYSNKSKVELVTHMADNGVTFDAMGHPVGATVSTRSTVVELAAYCRKNKIDGFSNKRKDVLIEYMASNGVVFVE